VALSGDEVRFLADGVKLTSPDALRDRLRASYPGFEGLYRFLEHCVSHDPDALTGRTHSISVLYPGGSSSFIAECERRTVQHRSERVYIELLAEVLGRLVRASPGRKLRILEVGGGRGVLTFPLLSALADADLEYCFTDLGKTFVDDARTEAQRLQLTARMRFGLLDISQDPRPQGYEPRSFDVIVAFNVVHATRDVTETLRNLRTLLVPGGTLALVEMVRARRWDTMTWGLAEGWWSFDDAVRKGSPLLGLDAWEALLHREGFERVAAWPRTGDERLRGDHGLVLARRALVEEPLSRRLPQRAAEPARERRATVSPSTHPRPPLAQPYVAPRTAMERQLAVICQELLGVAQVGVHDDFFELGADSLITLRLTERIRQELGLEVPQHVAFRGATIERMARAIEGEPDEGPSHVLIPLQSGGSRPPLFFVHPAAGVVFPYVELARLLGPEQPFYGLQAAGLDGRGAPDKHIEDMAARYVAAIRTIDPEGPYYLGGFSFGCFIAFEMAQQLRRAGKEVALLALIDEPAPISGHRPSPFVMAKLLTAGMIRSSWPYFHDYLYLLYNSRERTQAGQALNGGAPAALRSLLRLRPDLKQLESFLARSTMANYIPRDSRLLALQQPAMIPMFRMFMLHVSETLRYRPKAYAGRVTLFKCTPLGGLNAKDPTCGWGLLAAGGVDVHEMPGEHLTMLRHPHVRVFAERLRDVLDSVRQQHGRGALSSAR
jgi:thioesterase domain-containing protein/SAM-dependent methyltransferase